MNPGSIALESPALRRMAWAVGVLALGAGWPGCAPPLPPDGPDRVHEPAAVSSKQAAPAAAGWSEEAYDPSERHLRHAARQREHAWQHERLGAALEQFGSGACGSFPPSTRPLCPLFGEIESVERTDTGVRIELGEGVPVEAVMDHMRCHAAFARTYPRAAPGQCPLYVEGVQVGRDGDAVVLVGLGAESIGEIHRRAAPGWR
jgi:hypothetical protein